MSNNIPSRILQLIDTTPWAIMPVWRRIIRSIAARQDLTPEMLQAVQGSRMDRTESVTMREGGIAVLPVEGPIFRYANIMTDMSGATSLEILAQDFDRARTDPRTRHIVLYVASPGGQGEGIDEFSDMIARSDVPVTSYIAGYGASAAYEIAAAATQTGGEGVLIAKSGVAGSIGVVATAYVRDDDDAIEIVSEGSEDKRPDMSTDEGRATVQRFVNDLADVFRAQVAEFRGMSIEDVLATRGGLFVGAKAADAGLVDRVGDFETLITELSMAEKKTVTAVPAVLTKVGDAALDWSEITAEQLLEKRPDIVKQISAVGVDDGKSFERERIKGLFVKLYGDDVKMNELLWNAAVDADNPVLAAFEADQAKMAQVRESISANRATPLQVKPPAPLTPESKDDDFDSLVKEKMGEGMTRAQAVRWVVENKPEAHESFLSVGAAH